MGAFRPHAVDPHWAGDVFNLLLAQIFEDKGQPIADVVMDRVGDEHPAGIGQGFDPCGDVDTVAIEIVARLRAITPVVIPDAGYLRNPEHRELYLSGRRLAAGETA